MSKEDSVRENAIAKGLWRETCPKLQRLSHALGNLGGSDVIKAIDQATKLILEQKKQIPWKPVKWEVDNEDLTPITIDVVRNADLPKIRYAVRRGGMCLNKKGEWEYEPMPSSRTNAFFKRCRFSSFEKARKAADGIKQNENS